MLALQKSHLEIIEGIENGELPPIAGGAEAFLQLIANPAGLTTTTANLVGPLVTGGLQAPLILAIAFVPNTTGLAAGQAAVYNLIRSDTSAVIGSCTCTNAGAGAGPVGPGVVFAVVPQFLIATAGVTLAGLTTAGTAQSVATATAPILLFALGLT